MAGAGASAGGLTYQSTYRRAAFAIVALLVTLCGFGFGLWASLTWAEDGNAAVDAIVWLVGATFGAMALVLLTAFRTRRWTIADDGLTIVDRPKVPLTGISTTTHLRFAEIAALRDVENGLDTLIELETRAGRRFLLPQARGGRGETMRDVAGFADRLRQAMTASATPAPAGGAALGFWNTVGGLTVIALLFVPTLPFALVTLWAVIDGGVDADTANVRKAAVIAVVLPLGVAWLWWKSWRQRRRVLAGRPTSPDAITVAGA